MTHKEKIENIACSVCGKPKDLPCTKCYETVGRNNPLCHDDYDKCRIEEKSDEQLAYVLSPTNKNIFLKACPGSGKTEVVGLKAAYEIKRWDKPVGGIAILTFTNNAAEVIRQRVSQFAGVEKIGYPHYIGTFDSWLHGYIAHPLGHLITGYTGQDGDHSIRIIDASSSEDFLNAYSTKYSLNQTGTVFANHYYYDRENNKYVFNSEDRSRDVKRNSSVLESWQIDDLINAKNKFYEAGFATYQDLENIVYELLASKNSLVEKMSKRFPLIIVDECQDLSWIQLQILKRLKDKGSVLHFVGDLNQAIYGFKKVEPEKVKAFTDEDCFENWSLTDNFRSCQSIVNLCQIIVRDNTQITGTEPPRFDSACLLMTYQKKEIVQLPNRFEMLLKENNLDLGKSAIVTRNWANVGRLRPSKNDDDVRKYQMRLSMAIYLWKTRNIQAVPDALKYMGRFFVEKYFDKRPSNAKQYYCPECITSAIQWRLFLAKVLDKCVLHSNIKNFDVTWSKWADFIREDFGKIAQSCQSMLENESNVEIPLFGDFDGYQFGAVKGKRDHTVTDSLPINESKTSNIRITTIHSVKGETLDAIMLVSAMERRSVDGHWEDWLKCGNDEAARLAYVASSRPKYLLVWAIPENKDDDYSQLIDLGFVLYP